MNFWIFIYVLALSVSTVYFFRFLGFSQKLGIFLLVGGITSLPIFGGFSIAQWCESLLGQPSLFLFFLSFSACFVVFYAPKERILPLGSKAFIFLLGLVIFLGNLNLLWGVDFVNLGFQSQMMVVLGILIFAFSIDVFLGILYFACILVMAFGLEGNVFLYLTDISVWLYALFGLFFDRAKEH